MKFLNVFEGYSYNFKGRSRGLKVMFFEVLYIGVIGVIFELDFNIQKEKVIFYEFWIVWWDLVDLVFCEYWVFEI